MKVRTVKEHSNEYGVREGDAPYVKHTGRVYDVDEATAEQLIDAGLVEKADGASKGGRSEGTGAGSK
jgi:predicted heme/steroid binding protein